MKDLAIEIALSFLIACLLACIADTKDPFFIAICTATIFALSARTDVLENLIKR